MSYIKTLQLEQEPFHYGKYYAGQTLNWLPSDSEEEFNRNIKDTDKRAYLESKGWLIPGCFTYKMNQHGFRTYELRKNCDSIVALGCSFTAGIGLPIEDVWPSIIENQIDKTVYNLGVGGASLDTIFRIADHWIPKIQPSAVILLIPPIHRFEVYVNNEAQVYYPMDKHYDLVKNWFSCDYNSQTNAKKNLLAIENITNSLNIPLYLFDCREIGRKSIARDFIHQGPEDQKEIALRILKML